MTTLDDIRERLTEIRAPGIPRDIVAAGMVRGVGFDSGEFVAGFDVMTEWFYPFVQPSSNAYELHTQIRATWENFTSPTSVTLYATDVINSGYNAVPQAGKLTVQTELAEIFVRRWELWPLGKAPE